MIEATGLTRRYGRHLAVDDVSFTIARGEVVGFLGPNGAGKTSTLRMLAGSLAPTAGRAAIGGHDVVDAPREARRLLGYLPERPPLYDDLRVAEHVAYCARLSDVPDPVGATRDVLARVGIADAADRWVGHLSKGYRQRVGLAAALVHAPAVVLLDEPASGLDPVQRVHMRRLVRALASDGVTVLLSTHVLAEVEDVCDRVLVVHQGRLAAEHDLRAAGGAELVLRLGRPAGAVDALAAVDGVTLVESLGGGALRVVTARDVRADVARAAVAFELLELRATGGLEALFLRVVEGA